MISRKETCSNSLPVECPARESALAFVTSAQIYCSHVHNLGLCQSGTARPSSSNVWLRVCKFRSLMKEGNKPTSNARIMPEARGEASQDFITLSKASELSRVETEMVSFHSGYTDCLRNQCQNLRLLTLVLNFSCNYNDVSFCQQALTLKRPPMLLTFSRNRFVYLFFTYLLQFKVNKSTKTEMHPDNR